MRQKTAAGARSYYHSDGLGSTSRLTDASENVTDSFKYEAWGSLLGRTGTTQTPFQYVGSLGYYTDTDSGLMMLGARYYNAGTERFVSVDPVKDGLNWYRYAANNPVNLSDPSGTGIISGIIASIGLGSNPFGWSLVVIVGSAVLIATAAITITIYIFPDPDGGTDRPHYDDPPPWWPEDPGRPCCCVFDFAPGTPAAEGGPAALPYDIQIPRGSSCYTHCHLLKFRLGEGYVLRQIYWAPCSAEWPNGEPPWWDGPSW